ncbi:hypothetical protein ACQ4PT_005848 [Festuca glaucescens]
MGKRRTTGSSNATAGAAKGRDSTTSRRTGTAANLDWAASTISKRDENKLRSLGLISSAESDFVHPGSASRPKPPKGFIVMFTAFLHRGLSLPAHELLRCLLFSYGIQLWQLTPNSILHLSIFITVCEAFLGIDPHWGLWRKIFYVKRHSGGEGPHVVGGVGFVVRKEASTIVQCYPSTPESGAAPEDDDAAEETEDDPDVIEDSDVSGDEALDDDALFSRRRRRINEDLMATAELSPSGRADDDANASPSPAPSHEASAPPAPRRSSGFFAEEDDLISLPSNEDEDVPPPNKARMNSENPELMKESTPLSAEDEPVADLPPRRVVEKVKASTVAPSASASVPPSSNNHPIHAAVDIVVNFADQFVPLEAENVQLRKATKSSADQVQEANRLAAEAWNENASLNEELKKLKKNMKEEQESRFKAFVEADKKDGALRKSIESLLNTTDMPVDRTNKLRVDSMSDALSFAVDSSEQIQDLLKKAKGDLSKLFSMMFPKLDQNKTLGELANTFFIDSSNAIEGNISSLINKVHSFL